MLGCFRAYSYVKETLEMGRFKDRYFPLIEDWHGHRYAWLSTPLDLGKMYVRAVLLGFGVMSASCTVETVRSETSPIAFDASCIAYMGSCRPLGRLGDRGTGHPRQPCGNKAGLEVLETGWPECCGIDACDALRLG